MARALDPIAVGDAALAHGDWDAAREAFEHALETDETPEVLEGLALAAWFRDDAPATLAARERAYQLYRERGDQRGAGRIATWLAWDFTAFRGEAAIANGWLRRAHRLLDGAEPCAEQGWLALREASIVLAGDAEAAQRLTADAAALGTRL